MPSRPTVLDATALSNFACLDQVAALRILSRPVAVPAVRGEIRAGVDSHPFLDNPTDALSEAIPVVDVGTEAKELRDTLADRLDPGEAGPYPTGIHYANIDVSGN